MSARTIVLIAVAAVGCGAPAAAPRDQSPSPPGPTATELEDLFYARADSARQRFTDADVHFVTGMIGHHAQALIMSELAPSHGASSSVRTLTARIINAQTDEIALMQQWLRDRGLEVPEVHISGLDLMVHGADHAMSMPGMLTQSQLEELDSARGADFDRLFLTYMIQHHEGAVTMVHELFGTDGAGQDEAVFKLASDVQVDQITEIERMKLMLNPGDPS